MIIEKLFELVQRIDKKIDSLNSIPVKTHLKAKGACEYLNVSPNTLIKICATYDIEAKNYLANFESSVQLGCKAGFVSPKFFLNDELSKRF